MNYRCSTRSWWSRPARDLGRVSRCRIGHFNLIADDLVEAELRVYIPINARLGVRRDQIVERVFFVFQLWFFFWSVMGPLNGYYVFCGWCIVLWFSDHHKCFFCVLLIPHHLKHYALFGWYRWTWSLSIKPRTLSIFSIRSSLQVHLLQLSQVCSLLHFYFLNI